MRPVGRSHVFPAMGTLAYVCQMTISYDNFVYRVPTHLRQKLTELAFAQGCYLDCSAVGKDVGSPQHKMPLRLALELVS